MRSDDRENTAGLSRTASMTSGPSCQVVTERDHHLGLGRARHSLVEVLDRETGIDRKGDVQHASVRIVQQRLDRHGQRVRRKPGRDVERIAVVAEGRQHLVEPLVGGGLQRWEIEAQVLGEVVAQRDESARGREDRRAFHRRLWIAHHDFGQVHHLVHRADDDRARVLD